MGTTFLSDEWIDALDGALRAASTRRTRSRFVLEQVVVDVPARGEVRYSVIFDESGARVARHAVADVRITTDFATATEMALGTTNAQRALAGGQLRIGGRMELFSEQSDAIRALGDAAAELRSDTDFSPS
jgi:SCP-2 sterol transfer family